MLSVEGASFLDDGIESLKVAYDAGIRHIQLVHFVRNTIGDFQTEPPTHNGLTEYGQQVVKECNRLGILVDLAHCTSAAVEQALAASTAPVVWSHSSVTKGRPFKRNADWMKRQLGMEQAKAISAKGGVVGLWGLRSDVGSTAEAYGDRVLEMAGWLGDDHVAFGTDMNAVANSPVATYADVRRVVRHLEKRIDAARVRKIAIGNYARACCAAPWMAPKCRRWGAAAHHKWVIFGGSPADCCARGLTPPALAAAMAAIELKRSGAINLGEMPKVEKIHIEFTLFSAFYSPLISTMSGGFLKAEGLDASWSVAPPGVSAIKALEDGTAQVIQTRAEPGVHVARQGRDAGRGAFRADQRDGRLLHHRARARSELHLEEARRRGGRGVRGRPAARDVQVRLPQGRHRLRQAQVDLPPAAPATWTRRSAKGKGRYIQQQGPFPQQLEADGVGHVVAEVGPKIGPVAFSSLAATRGVARLRHGEGVHARLRQDARLYAGDAGQGDRKGGEVRTSRRSTRTCSRAASRRIRSSAAGRRMSRSPSRRSRWRSTCSSISGR